MLSQIIGMSCLGIILIIVIGGEMYVQHKNKNEK